ncbi:unnamed protein product, partial [Symbiodinium necroappetens]
VEPRRRGSVGALGITSFAKDSEAASRGRRGPSGACCLASSTAISEQPTFALVTNWWVFDAYGHPAARSGPEPSKPEHTASASTSGILTATSSAAGQPGASLLRLTGS